MDNLRGLALSLAMLLLLGPAAFAGETPGPPCAPGETNAPPCSSQSVINDSTDPGETNAPPANAVDLTTIVGAVELALSLF